MLVGIPKERLRGITRAASSFQYPSKLIQRLENEQTNSTYRT